MKSPQVHHKVTVKTKRFRVQWFGQKINLLFFRRHVYNLELLISDTLSKEVKADINVLTVGSSHRVVRQVYRPLVILLHRGISNIAIRKNETPRIKIVSRIPVAIATYSASVVDSVIHFCVVE